MESARPVYSSLGEPGTAPGWYPRGEADTEEIGDSESGTRFGFIPAPRTAVPCHLVPGKPIQAK